MKKFLYFNLMMMLGLGCLAKAPVVAQKAEQSPEVQVEEVKPEEQAQTEEVQKEKEAQAQVNENEPVTPSAETKVQKGLSPRFKQIAHCGFTGLLGAIALGVSVAKRIQIKAKEEEDRSPKLTSYPAPEKPAFRTPVAIASVLGAALGCWMGW